MDPLEIKAGPDPEVLYMDPIVIKADPVKKSLIPVAIAAAIAYFFLRKA